MQNSKCKLRVNRTSNLDFAFCILTFALPVSASTGCSESHTPRDPSVITVAVRSGPNTLDPRLSNDEATQRMSQLVYSALLEHTDDLRIRPSLALRLDNPDPLTYVAHLRQGVRFHDGHELTSADVAYTFTSLLSKSFISARPVAGL